MAAATTDDGKKKFIIDAINDHKTSVDYRTALDADLYAKKQNATIRKYQKVLYTMKGEAVPDNYTANHKCASGFFNLFTTQLASFELGNGVTFEKPETKERFGRKADTILYKAVKAALVEKVSFVFFNFDHLEFFRFTEFVPLFDAEDGGMKAGIRFWQLGKESPLRVTLYELDGYTEYVMQKDTGTLQELKPKRTYKQKIVHTDAGGDQIYPDGNYPDFPIVPMWGNDNHQSELIGLRENIDCYDLIKSGFANDLDDASMIYWTLENCGGMDDISLAQFVERMKTLKAAVVDGNDGAKATSHTVDVPYQSRETYLRMLSSDLYRDAMALDVSQIAAGAVTATQIKAAYEPLNEKADELEMCLFDLFDGLFAVAGIDDTPTFHRSMISNAQERIDLIIESAEWLGDEETIKQICGALGISDKADDIIKQVALEKQDKFEPEEE